MSELLPCPFCGEAPSDEECYWPEHQGWMIGCTKCEVAPMVSVSSGQDPCITARPETVKEWNTRHHAAEASSATIAPPEAEYAKAFIDMLAHGEGFMKDGKHVKREDVYAPAPLLPRLREMRQDVQEIRDTTPIVMQRKRLDNALATINEIINEMEKV